MHPFPETGILMTPKKFRIMKKATRQVRPLKWKSDEDGTHGPFETRPHWVGKSVFIIYELKLKRKRRSSNQIERDLCPAPTQKGQSVPIRISLSPLQSPPHYFLSERKGRFRYIDIFIGAIDAYHDRWLGQSNPSRVIRIADDGQPRGASLSLRNCLLTNLKIMSGAWDIIMLFLIFFFFFFFIFHFNFLPV